MSFLLAISFGPVQSFIAAARRTRDLKAGSDILLIAVRASAKAILEADPEAKLIFPNADLKSIEKADAANIIVAETKKDPKLITHSAKEAFHTAIKNEWSKTLDSLDKRGVKNQIDLQLALQQLQEQPEIYSAWQPVENNDYHTAKTRLFGLLASRKALRDFNPGSETAHGRPKSPLNPEMEGIFNTDGIALPETVTQKLLLNRTENLDAFSLIKRLRQDQDKSSFPSTRQIVVSEWLDRNHTHPSLNELQDKVLVYKTLGLEIGDALLDQFDTLESLPETERKEAISNIRSAVRKTLRETDSPPFRGYFALIVADGDSVGKALDTIISADIHRKFSGSLAEFAASTKSIVEKSHGALVYSGGDDVLALVPASTAINCAEELERAFRSQLEAGNFPITPTLSVAIRVHHHADNLQEIVRKTQSDLKASKSAHPNKNRLRLTIAARAGSDRTIDLSFQNNEPKNLHDLVAAHEQGQVPRGWASELEHWSSVLADAGCHPNDVIAEYERIGQRKTPKVNIQLPQIYASSQGLASFAQNAMVAQFLTREGSEIAE